MKRSLKINTAYLIIGWSVGVGVGLSQFDNISVLINSDSNRYSYSATEKSALDSAVVNTEAVVNKEIASPNAKKDNKDNHMPAIEEDLQSQVRQKYNITVRTNYDALINRAIKDNVSVFEQDAIIELWSETDPVAAINAIRGDSLHLDANRKSNLLVYALLQYEKEDSAAVELTLHELGEDYKFAFIGQWAHQKSQQTQSPQELVNLTRQTFTDNDFTEIVIQGIVDDSLITNPSLAIDMIDSLPKEKYSLNIDQLENAGFFLAQAQGIEAVEEQLENYSISTQELIVKGVASQFALSSPELAYKWVTQLPAGQIKDGAITSFIKSENIDFDASLHAELSSHVQDENIQLSLLMNTITALENNNKDIEGFITNIASNGQFSERNITILKDLAKLFQ